MKNSIFLIAFFLFLSDQASVFAQTTDEPPIGDSIFTTNNITVIAGDGVPEGIFVYPNPAVDVTHVVLPYTTTDVVTIYLIDLNGRILNTYQYAPGSNELAVDINILPTGLYSLRVSDPLLGYYNVKIVKD